MATVPLESASPKMFCGECGGSFPVQDLARFGNHFVCANCKPGYEQRLREGLQPLSGTMSGVVYGGFWIRFLAVIIDGMIVGAVSIPIFLAVGFGTGIFQRLNPENPALMVTMLLMELGLMVLVAAYEVWFISQKGGTPGKLVLGLRVVTADGKNLSMAHALGRYLAYILSGLVLYIGYIIAAFDPEKRALHDHICNTRVVRR